MATAENIQQTIEHLFRHESGKLVSVLTRIFGPQNLEMAEDVVQDSLLKAMNTWKFNDITENPSAWIFAVAKNKALDIIRKDKRHSVFATDISHLLKSEYTLAPTVNDLMNSNDIADDQLRMIFTCCHPSLSSDSQVALILKVLCGFSVLEIARAFLTGNDAIEKRLYRARQQLREERIEFEIPREEELTRRLETVLTTIYLVFNEGYSSTQHADLIRKDLLEEAMRLCELLCRHPSTNNPNVFALQALMHLNSARSESRLDGEGNILILQKQDRKLWNWEMIRLGLQYLDRSAEGDQLSRYHLEAAIVAEHVFSPDYAHTNWNNILRYYDLLYQLHPSPVIALNRAIVVSEIQGPQAAINAIEEIPGLNLLKNYYLLPATLGELYARTHNNQAAIKCLREALDLTYSDSEKKLLKDKIASLSS